MIENRSLIKPVLRIRIHIRMDLHDFGLLDPHPESAFQMRIRERCGSRLSYVKISVEILITNMYDQ